MSLPDRRRHDPPLSVAMREGSRAEHRSAEGSRFVGELLAGRVDAAGYAAYLRRLRVVYQALEGAGGAHRLDPLVAAVHDPGLERLATLDADLRHWQRMPGTAEDGRDADSPAAEAYAARIRWCAGEWGGLYLAHHYTRYVGDLAGGLAIGRALGRVFDLGGRGVAFYEFAAVADPRAYRAAYRARLDALPTTRSERARIVGEVQRAFRLNRAVLAELGERSARVAR